jgi:hypothetical protein
LHPRTLVGAYPPAFTVYINDVIMGNIMRTMLPGSVGFPILSVSLQGMGCEPVLNLAATPDEGVSIICTFDDNTIPSTFGEVDVCELYC